MTSLKCSNSDNENTISKSMHLAGKIKTEIGVVFSRCETFTLMLFVLSSASVWINSP